MALHLPPAVSVSKFVGGYKPASDYTDLSDTETNSAENTEYGPDGDIDQRLGSLKLFNKRITNTTSTSTGEPITGHYWFDKLGTTGTYHVVGAGNSVYQYTSATAVSILTGLTDDSNTFFTFTQIQDPRSASDEIVLFANGVDPIYVWNASASPVALSSFTSASSVPVAKYLLNFKERVYAFNIRDTTDADAGVKVSVSGFGSDGAADPHRFGTVAGGGSFYCGGAGKQGDIRGAKILNDQIVIYTRKSVWKFTPGNGSILDTSNLQQMQEAHGLLAPFSLVDVGDFHIFLSEQGVYAFDGSQFIHLSEKVDTELLRDSTIAQLQYAKGVYDKKNNQYKLYFPFNGSNRNDRCLTYDLRLKCWQPPVTGRQVSFISTFDDSNGVEAVIYGDYKGYLYQDGTGNNDGITTGYNGTVTTGGAYGTLTDSTASFDTTNDGLSGLMVKIISGTGEGQSRVIESNTGTVLTLESNWSPPPDTTSQYTVAGIDAYWRSKDYEFTGHDLNKLFRMLRARVKENGNYNLTLHYIVNFQELAQAISRGILLLDGGWAWGKAVWGRDRWGGKQVIRKKIDLRNANGTHLALRFSNRFANQTFRISGFDVEFKTSGKR